MIVAGIGASADLLLPIVTAAFLAVLLAPPVRIRLDGNVARAGTQRYRSNGDVA